MLSLEAIRSLRSAISFDPEAPVVALFGRSDGFSVGLDNRVLAGSAFERERLLAAMGDFLCEALAGSTRIVAACEGHAVAAGAMLLLVSDLRVGAKATYKIGFTEPGLGMPLPALPALLARMRLDRRRLHEAAVLGRVTGPEAAAEAGFFDQVVAPEDLEQVVLDRAESLADLSEEAYRGSLRSTWGAEIERLSTLAAEQTERAAAARITDAD